MKSELPGSLKKPYVTPQLTAYGDVREITQNVGDMGGLDGGGKNNPKSMA
jgi:hypothetical protein